MKKVWTAMAAVLAGTALFAFAGCGEDGASLTGGGFGGGAGTQAEAGAKSAYALGAVTTAGLLAANASLAAGVSYRDAGTEQTEDGQTAQQPAEAEQLRDEVRTFNEYFDLLEGFLDEGAFRADVTENTDPAYAFKYKLTVTGKDPFGGALSHTMYYTETEAGMQEEQDEGEYEQRVAYTLTGVLEMNGTLYEMSGYRMSETEREDGEEETSEELWIMASDPADRGNYVRMDIEEENEQEAGERESEREYVYRVYDGGRLAEETRVSFEEESEHGARETEYELAILKDGEKTVFEVERAERADGAVAIGVKYRAPQGSGRFVVTKAQDGTYRYTFADGSRLDPDDSDD